MNIKFSWNFNKYNMKNFQFLTKTKTFQRAYKLGKCS